MKQNKKTWTRISGERNENEWKKRKKLELAYQEFSSVDLAIKTSRIQIQVVSLCYHLKFMMIFNDIIVSIL